MSRQKIKRIIYQLVLLYRYAKKKIKGQKLFLSEVSTYKTKLDATLLVATKNGLYKLEQQKIFKLYDGEFYGISHFEDKVYVFEHYLQKGRIIRFNKNFENNRFDVFTDNLSGGCHQIDFIGNRLYVTDTYNNRIQVFDIDGKTVKEAFPIGKLDNGRSSSNYGHINSIFGNGERIFVLCHNETRKTEKLSEILELDTALNLIRKVPTKASSAHNCPLFQNKFLICDSLNNQVLFDNQVVFRTNQFTRGISIVNDRIVIGGSEYAQRQNRKMAKGSLYILNNDFQLLETISMNGMVQEIRSIDKNDKALSN